MNRMEFVIKMQAIAIEFVGTNPKCLKEAIKMSNAPKLTYGCPECKSTKPLKHVGPFTWQCECGLKHTIEDCE